MSRAGIILQGGGGGGGDGKGTIGFGLGPACFVSLGMGTLQSLGRQEHAGLLAPWAPSINGLTSQHHILHLLVTFSF